MGVLGENLLLCNRVLEDSRDTYEEIESLELDLDWLRAVRESLATDCPTGWDYSWKAPFHRFCSSCDFGREGVSERMCPVLEFLGSFVIFVFDPCGTLFCH